METHKLLLGIAVNNSFKTYLQTVFPEIGTITSFPTTDFHISLYTIQFFIPESEANLLQLLSLTFQPFQPFLLEVDKFVFAPSSKSPRMLWLKFRKNPTFTSICQTLEKRLQAIYPQQQARKSPIPHITLARFAANSDVPDLPHTISQMSVVVDKIILWKYDNFVLEQIAVFEL